MPSWNRLAATLVVGLALVSAVPAARAQGANAPAPGALEGDVSTAPVEVDGKVLFRVRGVRAYPAESRAARITERIRQAAGDSRVDPLALRTREVDGRTEILAGDTVLVLVFDADASLEGVKREDLALVYTEILQRAIREYRAARSPDQILLGVAWAAAATVLLGAFLFLLQLAFRRLDGALEGRFRRRIEALQARSFEIVRAEHIRAIVRSAFRAVRWLLVLGALYLYLQRTLALFPWTRGTSAQLAAWIIEPLRTMWLSFVADIPELIFLAVLGVVVRYLLKLLHLLFDGIGRGVIRLEGFDADWAAPTYKIVRIAVIAFALVVAYPYIPGSGSEAFKGVSLFLGVVFSLGSSSVVSNMVAGLALTYRRAFKLGDCVKIGEVMGEVTATRLQVTHLRTPKNEDVIVPNSSILSTDVTNYSTLARTQGLILHSSVGIGYEVPWRQVEAMLLTAAERTPGVEKQPRPFVLQRSLGDFAVSYEINVYCRDAGTMWHVYSDLHRNVQDVFNEHGVQIMTPSYESDPAEPKVVPKERWYAAPAKAPGSVEAGEKAASPE
jgi:small-conductance mechanosensitive channel